LLVVSEAGLGSITPVRDAAEGVFDGQLVDDFWVIFIEPLLGFGMVPFDQNGLASPPTKGSLPTAVPTDPLIYRWYEIVAVYGTTQGTDS
jgi:cyanate lyase-like protein